MKNLKKLTMLASAAVLAIGLTACGKSDYNGTYTGYQVSVPSTASTTGTNTQNYYNYSQQSMSSVVQASLSSNGDSVTGTYSLSSTGQTQYQTVSTPTSYQLTASTVDSNSLTNVMLIPTSTSFNNGGCSSPYTGSLASSNGGKSLSGTLNPLSSNTSVSTLCQPIQITLTRTN